MKNCLTVYFLFFILPCSFAQGMIYYVTDNVNGNSCTSPGCSGSNPIPFYPNSCRNNDTISTSDRWFVLKNDSASIRLTLTFNTTCNEIMDDMAIYEGIYPKLFIIFHISPAGFGMTVDAKSLVPGIPVYVRLMHRHERHPFNNINHKDCNPPVTENYNLCEKELTRPVESVKNGELFLNGNAEFAVNNSMIEFYTDVLNMNVVSDTSVKTAPLARFLNKGYIDTVATYFAKFGISANLVKEIQLEHVNRNVMGGDTGTSCRRGNIINKTANKFVSFQMELPSGMLSKYNIEQICRIFCLLDGVRWSNPTDALAKAF